MPKDLVLHLKGEYFDLIVDGLKPYEYRKVTPYWTKRLIGKDYDNLILWKGYPRKTEIDKRIIFKYHGYHLESLTHKEFGSDPAEVYVLSLEERLE